MIKFLLHGNCQAHGIATFLKLAPNASKYQINEIPQLVQFYQGINPAAHPELPKSEQENMIKDADIILYHAKEGKMPEDLTLNERAKKIPLSVIYNSAYFMAAYDSMEDWIPVIEHSCGYSMEDAVRYAVNLHDFGYVNRFNECREKMTQKERDENVSAETRMSWLFHGFEMLPSDIQPLRTYNHPTSIVFMNWTERILRYLREPVGFSSSLTEEAYHNNNMAGLPCEMSACRGAKIHLGIHWGGRPEDQESCAQIAREMIQKFS